MPEERHRRRRSRENPAHVACRSMSARVAHSADQDVHALNGTEGYPAERGAQLKARCRCYGSEPTVVCSGNRRGIFGRSESPVVTPWSHTLEQEPSRNVSVWYDPCHLTGTSLSTVTLRQRPLWVCAGSSPGGRTTLTSGNTRFLTRCPRCVGAEVTREVTKTSETRARHRAGVEICVEFRGRGVAIIG